MAIGIAHGASTVLVEKGWPIEINKPTDEDCRLVVDRQEVRHLHDLADD